MKLSDLPQPEIKPTGRTIQGRVEFVLTQSFSLMLPLGRGAYTFHVPAGVTTDFASIPRLFWWLISPLDPDILVASLIHDDLYRTNDTPCRVRSGDDVHERNCFPVDRFLADSIFRTVMRMYGARMWKRIAAYYAVRCFGWLAFRRILLSFLLSFLLVGTAAVAGESMPANHTPSPAIAVPATVVSVHDGDTATVEITLRMQVRLLDCWAAELKEPAGPAARDRLKQLAEGKPAILHVPLNVTRLDQILTFGRVLGYLWVDGRNVSEQMVESGHATRTKARPKP